MACRLWDGKPLPEPMLSYCQLDHCEKKTQLNWTKIEESAFKDGVCKMAAICSYLYVLSLLWQRLRANGYTNTCMIKEILKEIMARSQYCACCWPYTFNDR